MDMLHPTNSLFSRVQLLGSHDLIFPSFFFIKYRLSFGHCIFQFCRISDKINGVSLYPFSMDFLLDVLSRQQE